MFNYRILLHSSLGDGGSLASGGLLSSNGFNEGVLGSEAVLSLSGHVFKVAHSAGSLTLSSSDLAAPASV